MKVGVFSCGRKAGSLECRMPTVQRGTGKVDTHTYTHTHAYMYPQYVIHFKQTRGLVDPHEALFAVTEATTCLAHTHTCFEQPRQARFERVIVVSHTHTHTLMPLPFQPHTTGNAYSHTGEALCARGPNNCSSSCTATFDPWQHGKVGALRCQNSGGAS